MAQSDRKENKIIIIATVGPSSFDKSIIKKMDVSGIDIFRINISHTKIEDLRSIISRLKGWTSKEICIDTEGAQIRTGNFENKSIEVKTNSTVEFVPINQNGCKKKIPVSIHPLEVFHPGDILKIDFHSAILQITKVKNKKVYGRVLEGGNIGSNKGICLDRDIKLPGFTLKDIQSFQIAREFGIKTFALSFASSAKNVKSLRKYFDEEIILISKIESVLGMSNLKSICGESNAILIDRGDLSREVPIEKISFAQRYIQNKAKKFNTPVYVATNLLESMVANSKPTRAEIHDITSTLFSGVNGLVLAAESAIGKYPVESVRMIARIISEVENNVLHFDDINYLCSPPADRIIEPHGGELIQNFKIDYDHKILKDLPFINVDDDILSDVVKIAEGVYSPLKGFMNQDELVSVLYENRLPNKISWTLPILLQTTKETAKKLPENDSIAIRSKADGKCYAILEISKISKIPSMRKIANKLFEIADLKHPGVARFYKAGEYLLSGKVFLIDKPVFPATHHKLTPVQTRDIFIDLGWQNIIGFNAKSVIHKGHEFIQKKSLKEVDADAIFISPIASQKQPRGFSVDAIIESYNYFIGKRHYDPYGAVLGAIYTYSRHCGPREAVFNAICKKNFGCNSFIIEKSQTGSDSNYSSDAYRKLFDKVDIGIKILFFDNAYYCSKCKATSLDCFHGKENTTDLNDAVVEKALIKNRTIPKYMMRSDIAKKIYKLYRQSPNKVFNTPF